MKVAYSKYDMTASGALGSRKAVYISAANTVALAKADSASTLPCVGFTVHSASDAGTVLVCTNDILSGFTGLTAGDTYYLSQATAGEITNTKPTSGIVIQVGVAKTTTSLDIHILDLTNESHTIASHSDTTATGAELNELTDGSTTTLHSHSGGSTKAAVQARRTTTLTLTTSFQNVTMDTTDFENDTSTLQHNDTSTERLDVKAAGDYEIIYHGRTRPTSGTPTLSWKVLKNGSTLVAGSDDSCQSNCGSGDAIECNRTIFATLAQNDYLTFQVKNSASGGTLRAGFVFSVKQL